MQDPRITARLVKNELLVRKANRKLKRVVREHTPTDEQKGLRISFFCECSNPKCRERVLLTVEQYDKLHASSAHFIIAKGHETASVEKVTKRARRLDVVKKYSLKSDT